MSIGAWIFSRMPSTDHFSRVSPAMDVDVSIGGQRVVAVLERLKRLHGLPKVITVDNGPEFAGRALDAWAHENGVKLDFTRPGKPIDNAYIESFNGKLRQECLDQHWFKSIDEARKKIELWRLDYNRRRPHSSLKDVPPEEFLQEWRRPEPLRLAAIGGFS